MKGQSCNRGVEMGGMITTFWEPKNNIHLLNSGQMADILEFLNHRSHTIQVSDKKKMHE
jgi:hypothetical protein